MNNLPLKYELVSLYPEIYDMLITMLTDNRLSYEMKSGLLFQHRLSHMYYHSIKNLGMVHNIHNPDFDDNYTEEENVKNFHSDIIISHPYILKVHNFYTSFYTEVYGESFSYDKTAIKTAGYLEEVSIIKEIISVYDDTSKTIEDKVDFILMEEERYDELLYRIYVFGVDQLDESNSNDPLDSYVEYLKKLVDTFEILDYYYTVINCLCYYGEDLRYNRRRKF